MTTSRENGVHTPHMWGILSWRQTHKLHSIMHCEHCIITLQNYIAHRMYVCAYCTILPMIMSNLSNILAACSCLHDCNYNYIHVLTPFAITGWNLFYSNCQTTVTCSCFLYNLYKFVLVSCYIVYFCVRNSCKYAAVCITTTKILTCYRIIIVFLFSVYSASCKIP